MRRPLAWIGCLQACILVVACSSSAPAESAPSVEASTPAAGSPTASPSEATADECSGALRPLRVGLSSQSASHLSLMVANDTGAFENYGIDAELIVAEGGSRVMQSLLAGAIDIGMAGGTDAIEPYLRGADIVAIGETGDKSTDILVAREEIAAPQDLVGKTLGVSDLGGSNDQLTRFVLEDLGLDPEVDVTIISVGGESTRVASLLSGAIDAALMDKGLKDSVVEPNDLNVLFDFQTSDVVVTRSAALTLRSKKLDADRDLYKCFMKGWIEGIAYYKQHKDESVRIFAKYLETQDLEPLATLWDIYAPDMKVYPRSNPVGMRQIQEWSGDPELQAVDVEEIIDGSILDELEAEKFAEQFY